MPLRCAARFYRTYSEANDDPVGYFRYTQIDGYVQDKLVNRHLNLELIALPARHALIHHWQQCHLLTPAASLRPRRTVTAAG
jgi:hypothetical protein